MTTVDNQAIQKPRNPKLVLLIAILLPGMGQVLNNSPKRGFYMACFMIVLGLITFNLSQPHISWIGRLSGGIFIYAISVLDAYYWAKYRLEVFSQVH
ncbi:MAG: hypothetical protein WBP13_02800 [Methylophilaceae bacterium]